MGTRFEIQVVHDDPVAASAAIDAAFKEVDRVEAIISEWQSTSEMTRLNEQAGKRAVEVSPEMLELVERAREFSELTDGAFDVTFAGCGHLWSVRNKRIPSDNEITTCLEKVDYEKLVIDRSKSTLYLQESSMRAGSGAIGKGYGVDRAAGVLERHGIDDYVVDGGGDVRLRGTRLGRPWSVGVSHPRAPRQLLGTLELRDGAVVSSGDYERFFERDGQRYHHIINPKTGRPARRSIAVTVIAENATDADALSTGIFVMGPEKGIELAERLESVDALVVSPDLQIHTTSGFDDHFHQRSQLSTDSASGSAQ